MSDFLKKAIAALFLSALLFSAGRFSAPTKVRVETKTITVEVEKKVQDSNTITKKVEKDNPDGSKTITTVTDNRTDTTTNIATNTKSDSVKETTYAKDGPTVSLLAGIDVTNPTKLIYGASISKPILGPVSCGLWFLTSGTVGLSVGLKF